MKTSEILIGHEYAAARSTSAVMRYHVKVLAVGLPRKTRSGYGARTMMDGVRVEYVDGVERPQSIIPSREIIETWEAYEIRNEAARKRRDEALEARAKVWHSRARKAKRIDDLLAAHGVEARNHYASSTFGVLRQAGFAPVDDRDDLIVARFYVDNYVERGQVDEATLNVLIEQACPQN